MCGNSDEKLLCNCFLDLHLFGLSLEIFFHKAIVQYRRFKI